MDIPDAEGKEQGINDTFLDILRNSYDLMFHIDLKNGQYETKKIGQYSSIYFFPSGDFQKAVDFMMEQKIYPMDVGCFRKIMNLSFLIKKLCGEMREVHFQYRIIRKNGNMVWLENRIYLQMQEEEPALIMLVRDITKEKTAGPGIRERKTLEDYMATLEQSHVLERDGLLMFESNIRLNLHYISPEIGELLAGTYDNRLLTQIWEEDNIYHPVDGYLFRQLKYRLYVERETANVLIRLRNRREQYSWCRIVAKAFSPPEGGVDRVVGFILR